MTFLPGDALLYRGTSWYSRIIQLKTWHPVTHVEVSLGLGLSAASRDGQGVNLYPTRLKDLAYVWRPREPFNAGKALNYAVSMKGEPYGWLDLLAFLGLKIDGRGTICSSFACDVQRAGGIDPFNGEPSRLIAPFQWLTSPAGEVYEVVDGEMVVQRGSVDREAS